MTDRAVITMVSAGVLLCLAVFVSVQPDRAPVCLSAVTQ